MLRRGESVEFDGKVYCFGGEKRWKNIERMEAAAGAYVVCDARFKSFFAKDKEAKGFYEAAIEAEGRGRKGTGRYRLKI